MRQPFLNTDFWQLDWCDEVAESARELIRLAVAEDLGGQRDWTTYALVPDDAIAKVAIVARRPGVLAGMPVAALVLEDLAPGVELATEVSDGESIDAGQSLATLQGSAGGILSAERILLNFLGRLSGIATLTHEYVRAIQDSRASVYDTRKTTPGWRLLEKYAVRCGGGRNHRIGLHRAVMLKDNHVALARQEGLTLPAAVQQVRSRLKVEGVSVEAIEVEVDTLQQFRSVLTADPDIVLLDNMTIDELQQAVALRDASSPQVLLEASGGVSIGTIASIASAGVDRISVGALTHSAKSLDLGLDWLDMD